MGKEKINYYIVYDKKDKNIDNFLDSLEDEFKLSNSFEFEKPDGVLPTNKSEKEQLRETLSKSDLIIFIISKNFLITLKEDREKEELFKKILNSKERVLLVAYDELDEKRYDLGIFKGYKLFRAKCGAYSSCHRKVDFLEELLVKCKDILKKTPKKINLIAYYREDIPEQQKLATNEATPIELNIINSSDKLLTNSRVKIVDELYSWAKDKKSEPYCVILGEYGMGKTVSTMLLAKRLIEDTEIETIYIDLRLIGKPKEGIKLEEILKRAIENNYNYQADRLITPKMVIDAVQNRGALIIFDGLDEVLTHIDAKAGEEFIRELWRILPAKMVSEGKRDLGKVVLSCRTHYFKTVNEQHSLFFGRYRGQMGSKRLYRAYLMLPFNNKQIREYLEINFPNRDINELLELFKSIYNISELAKRPFNLWLISKVIDELEQLHLSGKRVEASTLYDLLIKDWLNRDRGKHQITPEHKLIIMENLAYYMWAKGVREMPFRDLANWFDNFLKEHTEIGQYYKLEIFLEDLRTATFLVRQDTDNFYFAHTSLEEYFVAKYLISELLKGGKFESSSISEANFSKEIFDFSAQIILTLDEIKQEDIKEGLDKGFLKYYKNTSETLVKLLITLAKYSFRYTPKEIDLKRANLDKLEFKGLNLQDAKLSKASLIGAKFIDCNLDNSSFKKADMRFIEFHSSSLNFSKFDKANLSGAIFRDSKIFKTSWQNTKLDSSEFISSEPIEILPKSQNFYLDKPTSNHLIRDCNSSKLSVELGINSGVKILALNENFLVSGGDDGEIIVWDIESFKEIKRFKGHNFRVSSLALNENFLVSGGCNGDIAIWDIENFKEIKRFKGHKLGVISLVLKEDFLVSGGGDGDIAIWDRESFKEIKRFKGHSSEVTSLAMNENFLVSGGGDGDIAIWDRESFKEIKRFKGHRFKVTSLAFNENFLVSGGGDRDIAIWDIESFKEIKRLKGHGFEVTSLVLKETFLVSGGGDGDIAIWDIENFKEIKRFKGHSSEVTSLAMNENFLVSGGGDRAIAIWDIESFKEIKRFEGHRFKVTSLAFNENFLVSGGGEGDIAIWDKESFKEIKRFEGHSFGVTSLVLKENFLVSGGGDEDIAIWDIESFKKIKRLKWHKFGVISLAMNENFLVSGGRDGDIAIWDRESFKEIKRFKGHSSEVSSLVFGENFLVSGGKDGRVIFWDLKEFKSIRYLYSFKGGDYAVIDSNKKVLSMSQEAWRYLYYSDFVDGKYRHFPLESSCKG